MKANELVTKRILEEMDKGNIPWNKPWNALNPMSVEGRPYSGINRLLLSFAPYADTRYLTYKKAVSLGGHVKKGEHGHMVVYYKVTKLQDKDDEQLTRSIPFMRLYTVFNVEQCEGLNLAPLPALESLDFTPIDKAHEIIARWGGMPKLQHKEPSAFYSPMLDYINMPKPETFKSVEGYYSTLFHEMTHSTGHPERLHRFEIGGYTHDSYSREELVAEVGSAFLCALAHIEKDTIIQNHAAYLQSWTRAINGDKNLVIVAASKAQKAFDMICGKVEEEQQEEAA